MRVQLAETFDDIIAVDNLLSAWQEFVLGKRAKPDVQAFGVKLMDNILLLHNELSNGTYRHSGYHRFGISDPKPREIHKASVRDRVLNHAVYRVLYPLFDRTFIADSYSCRKDKGTHAALRRFKTFAGKVSRNHTRTGWALKCDIRKFFATIDHTVLINILAHYIPETKLRELLTRVIGSFETAPGKGLPLGNLTSQLFVNIYMNEFDQFVKHQLKVRQYIRYADDFVLFSSDRDWLVGQIPAIERFLAEQLHLELHPQKLYLKTLAAGVDFLGWVHFPNHCVLRSASKRRMLRKLAQINSESQLQSYLGLLGYGDTFALRQEVLNMAWLKPDVI